MAALLGFTLFVFAFAGRVLLHYLSTGNHGIRIANPKKNPVAAVAGTVFLGSFAVSLLLVALDFFDLLSLSRVQLAVPTSIASPVGFTGIAIVVVAQYHLHKRHGKDYVTYAARTNRYLL